MREWVGHAAATRASFGSVVDYGEGEWGWQGSLRFVTGTEVWFLKDERGLEHLWLVMRVVVCVCAFW
jgi:hypothetical protein